MEDPLGIELSSSVLSEYRDEFFGSVDMGPLNEDKLRARRFNILMDSAGISLRFIRFITSTILGFSR